MWDEMDELMELERERYEDPYADEVSERYAATVADMEVFNLSEEAGQEQDAYDKDVAAGFVGDIERWRRVNAEEDARERRKADLAERDWREADHFTDDDIPF